MSTVEMKADSGIIFVNFNENTSLGNQSIKKVMSSKELKGDASRFQVPGLSFNAKLIGVEEVHSARGDKMCQETMSKLKMAVKQSGQHKPRIIVNVAIDGIRLLDHRTQFMNHKHPVHMISFISRDITDRRAFGYIFGDTDGKHKFFAIKTEKAAEALVLTLRDLFQVVYEMKKQEVTDAKHKIEDPTEEACKEETSVEPASQVANNDKASENSGDHADQVPNSNKPEESKSAEASDLLCLETELETIEQRIEQIDIMEEQFKELEAPPAKSSSWASELSSLSSDVQSQSQSMFSLGSSSFSASQAFPQLSNPQLPFGAQPIGGQPFGGQPFGGQPFGGQPFGGQPFGGQPFGGQPFGGQPFDAQPFGAQPFSTQPFGAQSFGTQPFGVSSQVAVGNFGHQQSPFGTLSNSMQQPAVPPQTGMVVSGQPNHYAGTQFPGSQPFFPSSSQLAANSGFQPAVTVTPANDPFGSNPFAPNSAFEDSLLKPARIESASPEPNIQKSKDFFGDLVDIGAKTKMTKSPKELFTDLSAVDKKPLNQLKVETVASSKPASPFGFQASEAFREPSDFDTFQASNPFGIDSFAHVPFASSSNRSPESKTIAPQNSFHDDMFVTNIFDDDIYDSKPLPQMPPPPLPNGIINLNAHLESRCIAHPPPQPSCTAHTPPLPPRPKASSSNGTLSSRSSLSSLTESQSVFQQQTPPLPPHPKTNNNIIPVPRPCPNFSCTINVDCQNKEVNHKQIERTIHNNSMIHNKGFKTQDDSGNSDTHAQQSLSCSSSHESIESKSTESHKYNNSKVFSSVKNTCVVVDPFVSADPFTSEDPFTKTDSFVCDPFAADPFFESSAFTTQQITREDPFISVVDSRKTVKDESDPFAVFDKTF